MKHYKAVTQSALFLLAILFFSCEGDEPLSKEEKTRQLLIGNGSTGKVWRVQSVTIDGVDNATLFSNMTIQFSETSFTVANGGVVWPSTSTWSFTDDEANVIERSDGIEMEVEVTENSLELSLSWDKDTFGLGRAASISGKHVFTFGV
jgi:hypothetical protein